MWRLAGNLVSGAFHRPRARRGGWLVLLVALLGSCYTPDFGRIIYKCAPNNICPEGLTCLDGKHCTYATGACARGGIMIAADTFVCPGDGNSCGAGHQRCPTSVTTDLCKLDISDGGRPEGCAICCLDLGDMAQMTQAD